MHDDHLDFSQTKENNYKEEIVKQLQLMDHTTSIPNNQHSVQPMNMHSLDLLDGGSNSFVVNEDERKNFLQTVNRMNEFLEEVEGETKQFNLGQEAFSFHLTQNMRKEMKDFQAKLIERKRNQPINLNQAKNFNLQLSNPEVGQSITNESNINKPKKEEKVDSADQVERLLAHKVEFIRLRKNVQNINELNPLTLNMEQIFNLPRDIQVSDDGKLSLNQQSQNSLDVDREIIKKKLEIRQMVMNGESMSDKKRGKMEKFIDELFTDSMEVESWVSTKEIIGPSINALLNNTTNNLEPSSHQSLNLEQVEIADLNFFRDLGPLNRKLNQSEETTRFQRKIQKKVFNNYIDIDANQNNINEDMYLLALSGLVPLDKYQSSSDEQQQQKSQEEEDQISQPNILLNNHEIGEQNRKPSRIPNNQDSDEDQEIEDAIKMRQGQASVKEGKVDQNPIQSARSQASSQNKKEGNFSDQTFQVLQNQHRKGQLSSNKTPNDLSVISEMNQSAGESMLANELLKAFVNKGSPQQNNDRQISKERNKEMILIEYESQIQQKLILIEELIKAKRQIENDQRLNLMAKKQQNLKNIERMRIEINKRIEAVLMDIIMLLDKHAVDNEEENHAISTETILKCSIIQQEDIDEQVKAKFLTRLVREYRKNRERAKQEQIREQVERETAENISKRFPSLNFSPDQAAVRRSLSRSRGADGSSLKRSKIMKDYRGASNSLSPSRRFQNSRDSYQLRQATKLKKSQQNEGEVTQMNQGWGVNESQRLNKSNHFKKKSKVITQQVTTVMNNTIKAQKNKQHIQYKNQTKKPINDDLNDLQPRKKPMRENIIKYTPSSALMNSMRRNNKVNDSSIHSQTQIKNKKKDQDESPGEAWIGDGESDFDVNDNEWVSQIQMA